MVKESFSSSIFHRRTKFVAQSHSWKLKMATQKQKIMVWVAVAGMCITGIGIIGVALYLFLLYKSRNARLILSAMTLTALVVLALLICLINPIKKKKNSEDDNEIAPNADSLMENWIWRSVIILFSLQASSQSTNDM